MHCELHYNCTRNNATLVRGREAQGGGGWVLLLTSDLHRDLDVAWLSLVTILRLISAILSPHEAPLVTERGMRGWSKIIVHH